jgi:surface protein
LDVCSFVTRHFFLPKVALTDTVALQTAVSSWCTNPVNTEGAHGGIGSWDTSGVDNMNKMFKHGFGGHCSTAIAFNGDVSRWDVSSVADMSFMFSNAEALDVGGLWWDTSSVTTMFNMFSGAIAFNGELSEWDVACVTVFQTSKDER